VLLESQISARIVHFTDSGRASWHEFACAIYAEARELGILNKHLTLVPISSDDYSGAARRPAFSVLDPTQTRKLLSNPGKSWRQGLRDMLIDYQTCS
jgi:dTDP-4-dehydrorhamnose reductase